MAKQLVITGSDSDSVRVHAVEAVLQALAALTVVEKTAVIAEIHRQLGEAEETKTGMVVVQATVVYRGMFAARSETLMVECARPAEVQATLVKLVRFLSPEMWATWARALDEEDLARAQEAERARD